MPVPWILWVMENPLKVSLVSSNYNYGDRNGGFIINLLTKRGVKSIIHLRKVTPLSLGWLQLATNYADRFSSPKKLWQGCSPFQNGQTTSWIGTMALQLRQGCPFVTSVCLGSQAPFLKGHENFHSSQSL